MLRRVFASRVALKCDVAHESSRSKDGKLFVDQPCCLWFKICR